MGYFKNEISVLFASAAFASEITEDISEYDTQCTRIGGTCLNWDYYLALLVGRLVFALVQATLDAASHVIDLARISKAVTTTDRVQAKVVSANITPTNVHPADTRAASAVDQVNDSAVVPLVAEVDLAAAVIWSLTVQQESRDTTDSPS